MFKKVELSLVLIFLAYLVAGGVLLDGSNAMETKVTVLNVSDPAEVGRWERAVVELEPDMEDPVFTSLSNGRTFKAWEIIEENGSRYVLEPRIRDSSIEYGREFLFAASPRGEDAMAYSEPRRFDANPGLLNTNLENWTRREWRRSWRMLYSGDPGTVSHEWKKSSVVLEAEKGSMPTYIKVYQDLNRLPVIEFSADGTVNLTGLVFEDREREVFVALSDRDRWIPGYRRFDLGILVEDRNVSVDFEKVYDRMNWSLPERDVALGSDERFRVSMYASSTGERSRIEFFRVED